MKKNIEEKELSETNPTKIKKAITRKLATLNLTVHDYALAKSKKLKISAKNIVIYLGSSEVVSITALNKILADLGMGKLERKTEIKRKNRYYHSI